MPGSNGDSSKILSAFGTSRSLVAFFFLFYGRAAFSCISALGQIRPGDTKIIVLKLCKSIIIISVLHLIKCGGYLVLGKKDFWYASVRA